MSEDARGLWGILTSKETLSIGGFFMGIVTAIFTAGKKHGRNITLINTKLEHIESRQCDVEQNQTELATLMAKLDQDWKRRIYHPDGQLIYVPMEQCEKAQRRIEEKLDKLIALHMKE